ncbi:hypothetical protein [Bradyrhizobium sp. G127]|uniref:hypothetical protein n=1 Tax=Bradyrhizobium sp. G127 TaxID=2904800 RepID=UPI001F2C30D1|nr:hypothetical protein [Bradyrhizobium sp. G127]MCF2525584.1 hypothetical protein [Bradyrhizobium sp. G127]
MAMSNSAPQAKSPAEDESYPADAPKGTGANTRAQRLLEANINPRTGLATDYLNHFNEAIMLLEMIPDMPDCVDDFLHWQPLSYREHFAASHFKARELAIEAYDASDPAVREEFDSIASAMTSILTTVGDAMRQAKHEETRAVLAEQAAGWVKPLVTLAGSMINGGFSDAEDVDFIMKQ